MKNTIAVASIFFSSLSIAQVQINVDEINAKTAQIQAEHKKNKRPMSKGLGKWLADVTYRAPESQLPKKRDLSDVEKMQLTLMRCVEGLLLNNQGGYEAPAIAQTILLSTMNGDYMSTDISDHGVLSNAVITCEVSTKGTKSLVGVKSSIMSEDLLKKSIDQLKSRTHAEAQTKALISALRFPEVLACELSEVSVEVGLGIVPMAGVYKMVCVYTNGKTRAYRGVNFGVDGGLGVAVRVKKNSSLDPHNRIATGNGAVFEVQASDGTFNPYGSYGHGDYTSLIYSYSNRPRPPDPALPVIVTGLGTVDLETGKVMRGFALGLGSFSKLGATVGLGVRGFNRARRWSVLLDLVNPTSGAQR